MKERTRWGRVDQTGKITLCQVDPPRSEIAAHPELYVCQMVRIYPWVVPLTNREQAGRPRCHHGVKLGQSCPLCRKEESCP
jgi:hypothetical protein